MSIHLLDAQISKDNFHWILTVQTDFFGFFKRERQFIGNGTVWHEYPSFKRLGLANSYDSALYSLWRGAVYEQEHRT